MIFTSTVSPSLRIGLRLLCAWPDMRYVVVRRLVFMLSMIVMQYLQYLYLFAHFKLDELQNLMDNLPTTLNYSLSAVKLMALWTNRRIVREILTGMDTDWRECVKVDEHLHLMTAKASVAHFFSNALLSFNVFAVTIYYLAIYNTAITIIQQSQGGNDTTRPFPMKILFPFEVEQTPIYELLFVALFVHAIFNMFTVTVVNSLIFTLVLHAGGQIDIIYQEFKAFSENVSYSGSSGHTIGILIEKHNKVISFSQNVGKLFSLVALTQIFFNTAIICGLGLLLMAFGKEVGADLLKIVFAYGGIMMEVFLFCFVGEYISLKTKSLADAAYNSLWYHMTPNQSKNVLFVIMRSQKQVTFTAGGMTNLSLEVFASIMKASASYVSVLYAMY
ncbi:odorant receptor 13a-like [Odontomachus brunneus]|uniref:odorant receptor 13a-like n=1 Tax=Odontomachus brunneus TaxID=486640 RepID=UPI0013F2A42D|nr:odorant receptor 13a-like [Odontomachus brunneus]